MSKSNVPDAISFGTLQALVPTAPQESEDFPQSDLDKQREGYIKRADQLLEKIFEECPDPVLHKVLAMRIIKSIGNYCNALAEDCTDSDTANAFIRDDGTMRSAFVLLSSIDLGETDPFSAPTT